MARVLLASVAVAGALRTPPPPCMSAAVGLLETHDFEHQLNFASRVAREAGDLLAQSTTKDALQHIGFELSHEPAVSLGQATWVSHVDEHIVSIALVDPVDGALIGAVCRPETDELLCAAANAGAWRQVGEAPQTKAPHCGVASKYANIIHVPATKCPPLEMALDNLGEKMPVELTRVPCCCCCEGLFELVSGRADVHISPPGHCARGEQKTPVPVLCAFAVLLEETGGCMSDCDGCEIDLAEALSRGTHDGGVLASEVSTHNFLLHSVRQPFAAPKLLLPRLADAMDGDGAPAFSAAAFHEWSVVERRSAAESSASDWSLEGFEARRSELGVGLDDVDLDLEDP